MPIEKPSPDGGRWLLWVGKRCRLFVLHELVKLVLVDHYFFVGVLTRFGVFDGLNDLYEITSGTCVGGTLSYPGVLRYLCHDICFLMPTHEVGDKFPNKLTRSVSLLII